MKTKILYMLLILSLILAACTSAFGQGKEQGQGQGASAGNSQGQGGGDTPPAEAIAACNGKAEQDACQFTDKNGDHTGVCKTNPDNQFACAPDRGPNAENGGQQPQDGAYLYSQAIPMSEIPNTDFLFK